MYKAILFDLGKVLIPFDFRRGYRALERHCGRSEQEIRRRIAGTRLVERFEKGLIEPRDFVAQFSELLETRLDYTVFCQAWNSIFYGQLIPDRVLESLAARYRLLLISNTNLVHFEMIRQTYRLVRHFHEWILSFEVHAMKPEPEIYRAAIARAGCRPAECFYTDDIASFVEAGRREGIDAVQFESPEKLELEMNSRGIAWYQHR